MCRSIKKLRSLDATVNNEDVRAASLQFVRKISGYTQAVASQRGRFQ